ncbi:hypothetical protein LWI29_011322 [Acer saccharum]|uniref:Uncharacterized protein n=1 Tax=Acer saccharum TaxID=4024 RepID=A0AA39VB42_ACESA|nr:hypothetical protein LWI29_011322 [Acer saccharum]
MDYSRQDLRPRYGLYDDPFSQKLGNNQDFQWDYNEIGTISDEKKLVNLFNDYLQKNEETMSTQQGASQNMQEECYYNQKCIDSYQLDEGSLEGLIGELMQSNHQLVELLQERENGRFPSQPEQVTEMEVLRSGMVLGDSNKEATIEEDEVVQMEGMGEKELEKEGEVKVTNPEPRP